MKNRLFTLLSMAAFSLLLFSPQPVSANDPSISITNPSGVWINTVGTQGSSIAYDFNGAGTNQISWGETVGIWGQSSYLFTVAPESSLQNIQLNTPVLVGTMTEFNQPINVLGGAITATQLSFAMNFTINGQTFTDNVTYNISHDETLNIGLNLLSPINNDSNTFLNNGSQSMIVTVNGIEYQVSILGFSLTPGGPLVTELSVPELNQASVYLSAEFSEVGVQVPEPMTYALLGGLLGAAGLLRARRIQPILR